MRKISTLSVVFFFILLSVKSQDLRAVLMNQHVELQWSSGNTSEIDHFELERRGKGEDFKTIALVLADTESAASAHLFKDKLTGVDQHLYYRVHYYYTNGSDAYSDILSLQITDKQEELLKISPDVAGCKIHLNLPSEKGSFLFRIYNMKGQLIDTQRTDAGSNELGADKLVAGNYFMEAYHPVTGKRYYGTFSL